MKKIFIGLLFLSVCGVNAAGNPVERLLFGPMPIVVVPPVVVPPVVMITKNI